MIYFRIKAYQIKTSNYSSRHRNGTQLFSKVFNQMERRKEEPSNNSFKCKLTPLLLLI